MKYFTIEELCKSSTAEEKGIDNSPDYKAQMSLADLVENVLDPLREWYGKPIYVNSGYRCKKLNSAVGGSKTSQHMKGEAADITARSKEENRKLFNYIKQMLVFDQLIDEKDMSWVHVSFKMVGNRRQILKL